MVFIYKYYPCKNIISVTRFDGEGGGCFMFLQLIHHIYIYILIMACIFCLYLLYFLKDKQYISFIFARMVFVTRFDGEGGGCFMFLQLIHHHISHCTPSLFSVFLILDTNADTSRDTNTYTNTDQIQIKYNTNTDKMFIQLIHHHISHHTPSLFSSY